MSQNALGTKLCAMYGKKLTTNDYNLLCQRRNVVEIAVYLKETAAYGEIFSTVDEKLLHRGQLEKFVRKARYSDYQKIKKYLSQDSMLIYNSLMLRNEIGQILSCLRFINSSRFDEYPSIASDHTSSHTKLNLAKMAQAKTYEELLAALEGTEYVEIIEKYPVVDGYMDYSLIEVALHNHFYQKLYDISKSVLTPLEMSAISMLYGTQQDLYNIMRIFRIKKYYPEVTDISKYILAKNYHLRKRTLNLLLNARDEEELNEIILKTPYASIAKPEMHIYFEQEYYRYIRKIAGRILRNKYSGITAALAYIELKEIEIKNVTNIIEGVRYKVSPDEIMKFIVK